jgi:hypothetical protein
MRHAEVPYLRHLVTTALGMTPIRRLEGVTYWVIEDPDEIRDFVGTVLRKEWEADMEDDGWPPQAWLTDLLGRRWTLQIINTDEVHGSDYLRSDDLARRSVEMKRGIERYGNPIWPIVVKEEGRHLADGYCRYKVLKEMGVLRLYAYIGSKKEPDRP